MNPATFLATFEIPDNDDAVRRARRGGGSIRREGDCLHFFPAETETAHFLTDRGCRRNPPETHAAVGAARDQTLAAGREAGTKHRAGMSLTAKQFLAAFRFPQAECSITTRRDDGSTVRREGGRRDGVAMTEARCSDSHLRTSRQRIARGIRGGRSRRWPDQQRQNKQIGGGKPKGSELARRFSPRLDTGGGGLEFGRSAADEVPCARKILRKRG